MLARLHKDDAEDAAQRVFLNAFTSLPRFNNLGVPFGVWLFSIAHNEVVNHYRDRRDKISIDVVEEPVSDDDPVLAALTKEISQELRTAVSNLKPIYGQVIAMSYFLGMTNAEIAAQLDIKEGNVRVRLSRGIAQLRTLQNLK